MAAVVLGGALRCTRARGGEEPEERRGAGRAREGRGGGVASPGRARAKRQAGGGRARAGGRRPRALQSFWRELEEDKGERWAGPTVLGQHSAGQVSGSGTLLSAFSVFVFLFCFVCFDLV